MGKQRPKLQPYVPPTQKTSTGSNPLLWIAALIIIFITSFLLFGGRDELPDDIEPVADESEQVPAPGDEVNTEASSAPERLEANPDSSIAESEPKPSAVAEPTRISAGAKHDEGLEARDYIQEVRSHGDAQDLGAVFSRAGQFAAAGKQTDAYLLYFFAAREGHAPSAFILGGLSDPNHYRPGANLSNEPDPLQSLKWYRVAANDGYRDAVGRLQDLQRWVEQKARSGDVRAQQLLLSFR